MGKQFWKALAWGLPLAVSVAQAATQDLTEYFHPGLNHYYLALNAAEAGSMDANPGWVRSGRVIRVWPTAGDAPSGARAVCHYEAPVLGADVRVVSLAQDECDFLRSFDIAVFKGNPFYAVTPVGGSCPDGTQTLYRGFRNLNGNINFRFANATSAYQDAADRGWGANGLVMCVAGVSTARKADAYRLLRQATFGPTDALVASVEQMGIPAWVEAQLNAPKSTYPDLPFTPFLRADSCTGTCQRDNYTLFPIQLRFLQNALNGEDQLRQRVAFALSQMLVTSGTEINHAYGMARYQQILLDHALGNYRELLYHMTLSPVMGRYLDMANSNKADPARGIAANENFAREILQLFGTGLYDLNPDGSTRRNAQGNPVATFDQTTIENFARVFTGWTFTTFDGSAAVRNNPVLYLNPMVAVQSNHDTGSKRLLSGVTLPAGQTAEKDLNDALDNIFQHPNAGPFVARQLIQKLVGGNPDPPYVARVAAVFNNNGAGVRGDLKAVTRAILLDPEARGEIKTADGYGHLTEPVLLATTVVRGLNGRSDGVGLRSQLNGMGQNLFYSPTVFNHYPPDHSLPATGSMAPEFAIFNSTTVFNRVNALGNLVMGNGVAADATVTGATGTSLDWSAFQVLAADPAALVDKLAWTFTAGSLSDSARSIIVQAVNAVDASDSLTRAKTAAYLVINSSQTQVER